MGWPYVKETAIVLGVSLLLKAMAKIGSVIVSKIKKRNPSPKDPAPIVPGSLS